MNIDITHTPPSQLEIDAERAVLQQRLRRQQLLAVAGVAVGVLVAVGVFAAAAVAILAIAGSFMGAVDGVLTGFISSAIAFAVAGVAVGAISTVIDAADKAASKTQGGLRCLAEAELSSYQEITDWLTEPAIARYRDQVAAQNRTFIVAEVEAMRSFVAAAKQATQEAASQAAFRRVFGNKEQS